MDWLSGILQGIFGTLLYDLLLAAMVAGIVAWLRSRQSRWAAPVLFGIAAFAAMLSIAYLLTGHAALSRQTVETTPENVEENVKKWVEELGLGITKAPKPADIYFNYIVTLKSGNPIGIGRATALPGFLQLQTLLVLSDEHQKAIAKMSKEQAAAVTEEVIVQLALSKMGYTIGGGPPGAILPMQNVILMKGVPITSSLTEASFATYLDEMDSAVGLVRAATALAIKHNSGMRGSTAITPRVVQQ